MESFEAYHFANDPFRGAGWRRLAERLFGGADGLDTVLAGLNATVFPADIGAAGSAESSSQQIEAGEERLDHVFMVGAQRIFARIDKLERRGGMRR